MQGRGGGSGRQDLFVCRTMIQEIAKLMIKFWNLWNILCSFVTHMRARVKGKFVSYDVDMATSEFSSFSQMLSVGRGLWNFMFNGV